MKSRVCVYFPLKTCGPQVIGEFDENIDKLVVQTRGSDNLTKILLNGTQVYATSQRCEVYVAKPAVTVEASADKVVHLASESDLIRSAVTELKAVGHQIQEAKNRQQQIVMDVEAALRRADYVLVHHNTRVQAVRFIGETDGRAVFIGTSLDSAYNFRFHIEDIVSWVS